MKNLFKAILGVLAVIVLLGVDLAHAREYSIRDKTANLTVIMDEVPAPSGQGTIITGYFKNEANGVTGTINTFYKSEITGTLVLEFGWLMDNCYGKYFVVPILSKTDGAGNVFQRQTLTQKNVVLNFIAGASCEGPLEKLKIELGEGHFGTGKEESHIHVGNECPHKAQGGQQGNVPQGNGGYPSNSSNYNNSGGNGANVNVNVNNGNNGKGHGEKGGKEQE